MGESEEQRDQLLKEIASLEPMSVPINFFHPNPALPLKQNIISQNEALNVIKKARELMKEAMIMVAGGRELVFKDSWPKILEAGANAIVIGDYLTTKGEKPSNDIETLNSLGYEIASNCHE